MTKRTLATSVQIDKQIEQMARQIVADYAGQSPVFVALLRGAAPFASKLMFEIAKLDPEFHPEIDYMMVSTYGDSKTAGQPKIVTDLAPETDVSGRVVIVLDDVLDKGITANFVMTQMSQRGAASVKLAVMVEKQTTKTYPITADYCGFLLEDVWLIGMGMDNASAGKEFDRWNPNIEVVEN